MKIFDCFMYFDEDLLLDLRLNILDKFVDKFVIVESNLTHTGKLKEFKFDINKFKKFENSSKLAIDSSSNNMSGRDNNALINAIFCI